MISFFSSAPVFQQSQELYQLVSVYWILADLTALEKESLFEGEEDGACEPRGFEMQDIIPLDDSTAGFAFTRCVLNCGLGCVCC